MGQLLTAPDEWLQQFEGGQIVAQYLRVLEG